MKKYVYVMLSQTGTLLDRAIRRITHGKYSHASICLDGDFQKFYSFGRIFPRNPFWGGYVMESPNFGTFKRFKNTEVIISRLEAEEEQYERLKRCLEYMFENKKRYKYNYLGLFLATFNRAYRKENRYYCSEFVGDTLRRFRLVDKCYFGKIIRPMDLMSLPNSEVVYRGLLSKFCRA